LAPFEAFEWEKAARGGLCDMAYPQSVGMQAIEINTSSASQ
jgi:hypothetical protein